MKQVKLWVRAIVAIVCACLIGAVCLGAMVFVWLPSRLLVALGYWQQTSEALGPLGPNNDKGLSPVSEPLGPSSPNGSENPRNPHKQGVLTDPTDGEGGLGDQGVQLRGFSLDRLDTGPKRTAIALGLNHEDADLLEQLKRRGIRVSLSEDRQNLVFRGPLDDDLRRRITENKAGLIELVEAWVAEASDTVH